MEADRKSILRRFLIELIIYAVLLAFYLLVVLRALSGLLARLAGDHQTTYALAGLALIVTQGLLLEMVTSFLLERLRLE